MDDCVKIDEVRVSRKYRLKSVNTRTTRVRSQCESETYRMEWRQDFSQITVIVDHRCSAMSAWWPVVVAALCFWICAGEFNAGLCRLECIYITIFFY